MIVIVQTNDGIDEHKFGYKDKLLGYTNSCSDINDLDDIGQ